METWEKEEGLISKKDLLQKYGISYGALYRWKRKGLIPDEWFLRRSTTTGQETFFRKDQICARIELIQAQKDDCLLDELANRLSDTEKDEGMLVVETVYGKQSFRLKELKALRIEFKDQGEELTDILKERCGAIRTQNQGGN